MSTPLTTEQVEEILRGCEGVTPGPWTVFHDTCAQCAKNGTAEYGISGIPGGYHAPFGAKADAAHIARLDPQTVSSLATELLALRKRVGELERTVEFVTRWAWRERTNGPLTDAERLSAIKFHPAIKPALPTPKEPS